MTTLNTALITYLDTKEKGSNDPEKYYTMLEGGQRNPLYGIFFKAKTQEGALVKHFGNPGFTGSFDEVIDLIDAINEIDKELLAKEITTGDFTTFDGLLEEYFTIYIFAFSTISIV